MKHSLLSILLLALLIFAPVGKAFAGSDPFIGEITIFAGPYSPRGFAFCEGQLLRISQNTALFSILGTRFGGDSLGRVGPLGKDFETTEDTESTETSRYGIACHLCALCVLCGYIF